MFYGKYYKLISIIYSWHINGEIYIILQKRKHAKEMSKTRTSFNNRIEYNNYLFFQVLFREQQREHYVLKPVWKTGSFWDNLCIEYL